MSAKCTHLDQIDENVEPQSETCEACKQAHKPYVSLRICLTCGHVGCCDDSAGKHARKHYEETGHPIMATYDANGISSYRWCFVDKISV